jgi:hypothetical protein
MQQKKGFVCSIEERLVCGLSRPDHEEEDSHANGGSDHNYTCDHDANDSANAKPM